MLECFNVEVTAVSKAVFWDVTQGSGNTLPRSDLRISRRKPAITLFLLSQLSVCARKQNQTAPPLVTFSNSNVTISKLWTAPTPCQSFDPRAFLEVQLAFRSGCGIHWILPYSVAYPGIFSGGGGSTNSAEDRGQREGGSGGSSPLIRGFTQFVIERNPYSD
jgi:hypothetical protein